MIRVAQLLLVVSALALWLASRLPWVSVGSFDGLGPPKTVTLNGAAWSTALVPLAVLLIAAALAGLAVRGWLLRAVALLLAVVSFAVGYLGITLILMPDVGPRGAELAGVGVATLVSSERHLTGAVVTLGAAVGVLLAAVLLMRSAVSGARESVKYAVAGSAGNGDGAHSERGMWDALDEGRDPTDSSSEKEGR
ncbi:MAG: TIGR02234 family membrane protein [Mycobacteriaceae bacterium]